MACTRLAHVLIAAVLLGCDADERAQVEPDAPKLESEPPVIEPPAVAIEQEVGAIEPPSVAFDPMTVKSAKVRIVEVHPDHWFPCGILHSTGSIEVEVLEVGEPAPRMILIISCPADHERRLFEVGAILQVELFAKRKYWPTPPTLRTLPLELPRRYVRRVTRVDEPLSPTNPASAPAPRSDEAPE